MREVGEYVYFGKLWSNKKNGNLSDVWGKYQSGGTRRCLKFKTVWGLGGESGSILTPRVQGSAEGKSGPQTKGAAAQGSNQTQRAIEGPSTTRRGEKSFRPIGSFSHITLRVASKGRIDEKSGMANPSCE